MEAMLKALEEFHHWVTQRISGMSDSRFREEGWEWSSVADDLEVEGMWSTKNYIRRRQATIA